MPVRKADDREAWLDICYANEFVATQVDDGTPVGPGLVGQEITSSASRPDVVAFMLAALQADPGGRDRGCAQGAVNAITHHDEDHHTTPYPSIHINYLTDA